MMNVPRSGLGTGGRYHVHGVASLVRQGTPPTVAPDTDTAQRVFVPGVACEDVTRYSAADEPGVSASGSQVGSQVEPPGRHE
jgi:hypothetical protein